MTKPTAINSETLDLVMREEDFIIYHEGAPLTTPLGAEFAHADARILKHLLVKFTLSGSYDAAGMNGAAIFSFAKDRIEKGDDPVATNFESLYAKGALLHSRSTGKPQPLIDIAGTIDFYDKNPEVMNLIFWSVSVMSEAYRSFVSQFENDATPGDGADILQKQLKNFYNDFSVEKKAAVNLLLTGHQNGLMLPLMLVSHVITPSEYANSTLALQMTKTNIAKDSEAFLDILRQPLQRVRELHNEALNTIEFLGFFDKGQNKISVIHELISLGESNSLEFKSTFRWNLYQNKKNPAIEHTALKTMAAFMNSAGGDLLIGVEDNGNILGIEMDQFDNTDKFLLHVWALIKSSMGQQVSPYLKTTLETIGQRTVCRVHCLPAPAPVFLRQKGFDESFYIRTGPGTASLEISEALEYIAEHWKK
ncbi:MAG TPA: ATP-binding protein [Bacteroidales bacterium]|nr:ATP-binding protein [Bacteroidales bacterium]